MWTESGHPGKGAAGGARPACPDSGSGPAEGEALVGSGLLGKLNSRRRLGSSHTVRNGWSCHRLRTVARAYSCSESPKDGLRYHLACLERDEHSVNNS